MAPRARADVAARPEASTSHLEVTGSSRRTRRRRAGPTPTIRAPAAIAAPAADAAERSDTSNIARSRWSPLPYTLKMESEIWSSSEPHADALPADGRWPPAITDGR